MNIWILLSLLFVLVIFFVLYLSMTAGRLDRLHHRIDLAESALDAQLIRRSSIALELASFGLLDPASSMVVANAAHEARVSADRSTTDRDIAESDLTEALNVALEPEEYAYVMSGEGGPQLLSELASAVQRVELSRRFLNDAVRACVQLRRQRAVRWFHLAGRTPWPRFRDLNDHVSLPDI
jgi:hypothetical protein